MSKCLSIPLCTSDISDRCQKLRDRQLAAPLDSTTLQDLVRNELKTKKHTATEGLVWLVRSVPISTPTTPIPLPNM